ncbi:hypothetical protein VPNG_09011 [Cytospora leucostoma]|uniref:DUF6546 domain-containing protein n=1 Tax=Cytospora leucostoma TaxID=1230097 RepID=A0A423W023_9PEZI|nr:hypothetical protein VPNG_09011 [Cytospora leucostoma]
MRSMILENLVGLACQAHPLSKYACVSTEWQAFFEKKTYRRLIVRSSQDDLDHLAAVLRGRLQLIRHIVLRIELEEYDCTVCKTREDDEAISRNNIAFTNALYRVLVVLSAWKLTKSSIDTHRGLTLELCVFSPSDTKHRFKDFRLEDTYPYVSSEDLPPALDGYADYEANRAARDDRLRDKEHRWLNGKHSGRPTLGSRKRILGTSPLTFDFSEFTTRRGWTERVLPKAPIITGFLIRRQYYRIVSAQAIHKLMTQSLTNLQSWRWERWLDVAPYHYQGFRRALRFDLSEDLPRTLKHLAIYLDTNAILHRDTVSHSYPSLGRNLALVSHRELELEVLALSFVVDAGDFFEQYGYITRKRKTRAPDDTAAWSLYDKKVARAQWRSLQRLALTCRALRKGNRKEINSLLGLIACVALHLMPRIEVVELWNSEPGSSSSFCLDVGRDGQAAISWRSTWDHEGSAIDPETVHAWNLVARKRTANRDAVVTTSRMQLDPHTKDYLAPSSYLRLWRDVFHPISYYQLRWECRNHDVG